MAPQISPLHFDGGALFPYTSTLSRHQPQRSVATEASGVSRIADSNISYDSYASGMSGESLHLSQLQFPPPPSTCPRTPTTITSNLARGLPSTPSSSQIARPQYNPSPLRGSPSVADTRFPDIPVPSPARTSLRSQSTVYPFLGTGEGGIIPARDTHDSNSSALSRKSSARRTSRQRRVSTYSQKSLRSQVSSFISVAGERTVRVAEYTREWVRVKPLPPVPTFENWDIQEKEMGRSRGGEDTLSSHGMLTQGGLPAKNMYADGSDSDMEREKIDFDKPVVASPAYSGEGDSSRTGIQQRRIKLALIVVVAAVLVIVAILLGFIVGGRRSLVTSCSGHMAGNDCSLDTTCVCTSSSSSNCNPVAASLVNLLPTVNDLFATNMTSSDVSTSMTAVFGSVTHDGCSRQALVLDVSPALGSSTPNRTAWVQAALMWSIVLSQSESDVDKLRDFILASDWSSIDNVDGPIMSEGTEYQTSQLGFLFDFAAQTVREPNTTFEDDGEPSREQLGKTDSISQGALDKIYTTATAMSTIRETAMRTYWESTLQQDPNQYSTFVSLFRSSPVLLPFDANSTVSTLLGNSTTDPFPPPQSCNPEITSIALAQLSAVETSVFGLNAPTPQSHFEPECFTNRPIYGRLDYLRLRLPQKKNSAKAATQAIALKPAVHPRIVVSNGPQFALLPLGEAPRSIQTRRQRYGTIDHMDHIILDFFKSIDDVMVASALVQYIMSQSYYPPTASILLDALQSLPILEVAVFGSITPDDISAVTSSFASPSGGLWFGTDQSLALRQWAINGVQNGGVSWIADPTSAKVVHDTSFTESTFNSIWDPAYMFFHANSNAVVGVNNITSAFESLGEFLP